MSWHSPDLEDRKRGVMAGLAMGDALGAGYEFGPALDLDAPVDMIGGGLFEWAPYEWTDDTSMAIPIARAVAEGRNLLRADTIEGVYQEWRLWAKDAPDVGNQTSYILNSARNSAEAQLLAKAVFLERPLNSAGNGCVMRTAPIALAYSDEDWRCAFAAETYAALTHADPIAIEATVRWTLGIAFAIRHGRYPNWIDRRMIPEHPVLYEHTNGYSKDAVSAAIAAIQYGQGSPRETLEAAVRGGGDTDTVAAIAGAMVGAVHGLSGLPSEWVERVHGWPGMLLTELPTVKED